MTPGTWGKTVIGASSVNREGTTTYAGAYACRLDVDSSGSYVGVNQSGIFSVGKLYSYSFYARAASGTPTINVGSQVVSYSHTLSTSYAPYSGTLRADGALFEIKRGTAPNNSLYLDSVTIQAAEILAATGIARSQSQDANFAVQLNGTSQYLSYTGAALNPGTSDFAMGAAVYLDRLPHPTTGIYAVILCGGDEASGGELCEIKVHSSGAVYAEFNDGNGTRQQAVSTNTLLPGNWYVILANFDRDGNLTLYVNDALWATASLVAKSGSCDPGNFFISRRASGTGYYFAGRIDNAFFTKRLLSAAERTWLFNTGKGRQWAEVAASTINDASLVSWWELDEASGDRLDRKGANHLVAAGSPGKGQGVNYYAGDVSRWEDISGRNNHLLQGAITKRPAWISGAVGGKPSPAVRRRG